MRVAYCITHAPHIPSRVASFHALDDSLRLHRPDWVGEPLHMTVKAPNWVWAALQWQWGVEQDADWVLYLQDDVRIAPNFWATLHAMLSVHEEPAIIGLHCAHPAARTLARQGIHWYSTNDGMIGVGYVLHRTVLKEFLAWRAKLPERTVENTSEDTLIGLFAMATDRVVWHPTPTIIDHDVDLKSTYGNDRHLYRRPQVTWEDMGVDRPLGLSPEFMEQRNMWDLHNAPHLGLFYRGLVWRLLMCGFEQREALRLIERYERIPLDHKYAAHFIRP